MSTSPDDSNPFEQLQMENEAQYDQVSDEIKSNVLMRKGFWALIGDILDLYIPKVVDTFISGTGATEDKRISPADPQSKL